MRTGYPKKATSVALDFHPYVQATSKSLHFWWYIMEERSAGVQSRQRRRNSNAIRLPNASQPHEKSTPVEEVSVM